MHVMVINGSPRVEKLSNTARILEKFTAGYSENGNTYEIYNISERGKWDEMRDAFSSADNILIALPLYVECIPGLLLEFLETVSPKNGGKMSFILQSGFAEGAQLRCGEEYLSKLPAMLGCEYGGTLVKGNNFGIRLVEGKDRDKITEPYREMGRIFGRDGNFFSDECKKFTGPEIFPLPIRLLVGFMFKGAQRKGMDKAAASWGCTKPLDYRPYES